MSQDWPHRRYNPLSGQWILCSPHRAKRPWLGQVEKLPICDLPEYDPKCYLCPGSYINQIIRTNLAGNKRAPTAPDQQPPQNDSYTSTFVFDNDFSALLPHSGYHMNNNKENEDDLESRILKSQTAEGLCKVVCFSPRLDLTVAEMKSADIVEVIKCWKTEFEILDANDHIKYIQIFENRGAMMGCSNPHPHCQIW